MRLTLGLCILTLCACGDSSPQDLTVTHASGTFWITHAMSFGGPEVVVRGRFTDQGFDVPPGEPEQYADVPLDTCTFAEVTVTPDTRPPATFLDAGAEITLDGPGGPMIVDRGEILLEPWYVAYLPASVYTPGATYTLSIPGGADVGASEVAWTAPSALDVTVPPFNEGDATVEVDRAQDLALAWSSPGSADHVVVRLGQSAGSTTRSLLCRFADDGAATLPAAQLAAFTATPMNSEIPDGVIDIIKYTTRAFPVPGTDDPGYVVFQTGRLDWARFL